ncbi:MAG: hypothetical protein CL853_02765 [Crocinitomicaceae bacterium]|nr:hypothetical protein [Crocinitomicaceae bacterium]|tara:strand:- start:9222 stop:10139 length:918 start_codon:yes stop_codon:yes gene_type:complete
MLVKLFKSNNPLILLFLPFVGVILLFSSVIFSFSFDKIFTLVALLVIILFTAIYLNKGINKTILFNKPLYLTALCVTFFSCIDLTSVSYFPIVLANLFLSFGFLNLIKIQRQVPCKGIVFNSSCFILLSAITYPPYLIFILLPWFSLSVIKSFNVREYLMPFLAILLFIVYVWLFVEFSSLEMISNYYSLFEKGETNSISYLHIVVFSAVYLLLILSLIVLLRLNSSATNRFKKLSWVMFLFLILALVVSLLNLYFYNPSQSLLSITIPISILFPFYLFHAKRQLVVDLFFSLFFIAVLIMVYYK